MNALKTSTLKNVMVSALALLMLMVGLNGCSKKTTAKKIAIAAQEKFGGVYICLTIDEFNALGFAYGDSVNVEFSNGFRIEDIPYYNGFYTKEGEYQICAYPGYPYINFCINYGKAWEATGVSEGDTATVTLNQKGKYLQQQEAMSLVYSNDRKDFDSDAVFANYRALTGGNLKEDFLYRAASPIDNQYLRAHYTDTLMERDGVKFVLDLADNAEDIEGFVAGSDFNSPYFLDLYRSDAVALLDLSAAFQGDAFRTGLASGLIKFTDSEGPYLINCLEGKDRTGFVCALLEGLAGATYQEMVSDYMTTYDNYYGINAESDSAKYQLICDLNLSPMLYCIAGLEDGAALQNVDYTAGAREYLKSGGMTDEQIDRLVARICQ